MLSVVRIQLDRLRKHQGFRRYFANTSWLLSDKIMRLFTGLLVGVWVARYLGPENFGILNFAMSFVALFGAFGKLGLDVIIVRNIVNEPDKREEILGTSLILRLVGAVILMLTVFGALQFTSADTHEKTIVMIIAFGQIFMSFEVFDFYFQSQVKAKFSGITRTLGMLVSSLSRIAFILLGLPLIWFAGAVIIEQLIQAICFIFFYTKYTLPLRKLQFQFDTAKSLLQNSWPLIMSSMVIAVYLRIDQVMIKEMLDSEAVGRYAAAVRLSEAWYFIPMVVSQSLFPAIIQAKKQNKKLYYSRLQRLYSLMIWMAIAIALPTTFLSDWLVVFLYGSQYSQAGTVLMIHIWAGVFVFVGVAFGRFLIIENYLMKSLYRTGLGAISNVILNLMLITKYGIVGAAISTLLAQFIANYFYDLLDKNLRYNFILKTRAFYRFNI